MANSTPDASAVRTRGQVRPSARMSSAVWDALRAAMREPALAPQLQAAADGAHLRPWTELLTAVVVRACTGLGWVCAAKGTPGVPLPIKRAEYLGIDVLAFPAGQGWRPPIAAFELENAQRGDLVAYALWKSCSVRADLVCLACYRRRSEEVAALVGTLQDTVLRPLHVRGDTLVIVGTRSTAGSFPDGYFRPFRWEPQQAALRSMTGR